VRFAAIDVGSNAIRLLLTQVIDFDGQPYFKKDSLIRIPIRLGDDVFLNQKISAEKVDKLTSTMIGFKHLMDAYQPLSYKACATSAMREAENGPAAAEKIREHSGINLEIVNGEQEAEIIYSNHVERLLDNNRSYIYIDVGGGSTELTIFSKGKTINSHSFQIGTVRELQGLVEKAEWKAMKSWVQQNTNGLKNIESIGSGGNINKISRIARVKPHKPIDYYHIKQIYTTLKGMSFEDRVKKWNLRLDRADVIVPAANIYLSVMKWAKSYKMLVPQFGFADGLVHILYDEYIAQFSPG